MDETIIMAEPTRAETLLRLVEAGGTVVALLLALSVAAVAVILAKLLQFRRARLGSEDAALAAAERLRRSARPDPVDPRHPAGELVALAAAARGRVAPEALREELTRVGRARLAALRSHFRLLEIVAGLAPLLGLFGTVLGMIDAFRALEAAGGAVDPAVLSGGIWQALLTTAVGLAVAMPTLAALGWLERRVERAAEAMDDATARIFAPPLDLNTREGAPRAVA
jgi:biopolymer transport protein ExbB